MLNKDYHFRRLLKQYIGENHHYYVHTWKLLTKKTACISWNWPAFFFGFIWCAYRKMRLYGIFIFLLYMVTQFPILTLLFMEHFDVKFSIYKHLPVISLWMIVVRLILMIFVGMYGNYLYYRTATSIVQKSMNKIHSERRLTKYILQKGGVSLAYSCASVMLFYGMLMLIEYIKKTTF